MAAHHQHQQLLEGKSSSSTSFSYSDVVPHHLGVTHLQNFDSNPEIYNLNSGIEMIGFQPKPQNLMGLTPQEQQQQEMGFMDDSSLRPCVFPCEGNERPSQGLSLSLSSSNPSTISLQSFELRNNHPFHHQRFNLSSLSSNSRDGFLGKSQSFHHQQEQQQQEAFLMKSVVGGGTCSGGSNMSMQFEVMRNSKYIRPAQELLNEFCNLGTKHNDDDSIRKKQQSKKNKEKWEFEDGEDDGNHNRNTNNNNNNNNNNASSSSSSSLYGVSLLELQKRKTKLLGMLEELDRRYKHYCEQMKEVVSSFEAAAGPGAAEIYTVLASRAMSRHFRCLRDTIVAQIKATKKAMGEKDSTNNTTVLGTTRGETPRLRLLDQNLRQQRAYHQMTMMESHPWRPQRGLPERSVSILRAWLFEHFLHPYPSDVDKHILARQTGLTRSQVSNWFINARVRLWKPMVEQMYVEETKEEQDKNMGSSSDGTDHEPSTDHLGGLIDQPLPPPPPHDQKPDRDQLIRIDPDSLSSILNNTATIDTSSRIDPQNRMSNLHLQQSGQFVGRVEGFGSMDHLDFPSSSSYNQQHHAAAYVTTVQNDNSTPHQGFGGGNGNGNGGGNHVSLTLGLQQHGGNGVSLAFSPASQAAASLFYSRDHMDEHQYSLLDEEHGQNTLPYRNLMGAQVLHDLA